MLPFFPPGSNPNPPISGVASDPNPSQGSTLPPFPFNQAPQFNFPNPANMAVAMFNPNPQIAMQSGTNMKNNVIQSTRTAANVTHENAYRKNFETNQHSVPYTRFQNNDSRQNSRQFSGSRGRRPGAVSGRVGGRGLRDRRELASEEKSPGFLEIKKKRLPTITSDEKEIKKWRQARKRTFPTTANIKKNLAVKDKKAEHENDDTKLRRKLVILMKKKRLPTITYDEKEIKQWLEARKRNFPTTANIKKKLAAKDKKAENENGDIELQRKFMDMRSLQAALPAQQPAADYYSTGAYVSQFYTQNPASMYASHMPQGGIPQTIDQTPNPQILNSMPQGHTSLGSNPFA